MSVCAPEVEPPGSGFVTVIGIVVALASEAAGTTARSSVALTNVVTSAEPLASTVEPETNAEPKAVTVVSSAPAVTELGERLVRTGVGLATVKSEGGEVPPPGAGFTTATAIVPAVASCAAVSVAVTSVALTNVVALGAPPNVTCEAVTKPVPVIVTAVGLAPAVALEGVSVVLAGAGFPTVSVTGRLTPPPGAGLVTTNGKLPVVAREVAGTVAVSAVALVTVVGTIVPLKETSVPETKPVPLAVTVTAGAPTTAEVGEIEATVTVGLATVNAMRVEGRRLVRDSRRGWGRSPTPRATRSGSRRRAPWRWTPTWPARSRRSSPSTPRRSPRRSP